MCRLLVRNWLNMWRFPQLIWLHWTGMGQQHLLLRWVIYPGQWYKLFIIDPNHCARWQERHHPAAVARRIEVVRGRERKGLRRTTDIIFIFMVGIIYWVEANLFDFPPHLGNIQQIRPNKAQLLPALLFIHSWLKPLLIVNYWNALFSISFVSTRNGGGENRWGRASIMLCYWYCCLN